MKQFIIYFLIIFSCIGCKKSWLEIVPFKNQVAETTDDYNKLMNNNEYYYYYTGGYGEAQLMGDEIAAEEAFFSNVDVYRERFFEWQDIIFNSTDKSSFVLDGHLRMMYGINKIIEEVMNSTGGTEEEKSSIRAEALATRAFAYFELVNHYCKPYNPTSANTDPGFPIITQVDINVADYPRGTLQETYDFIIKDLTEALASAPQKPAIVTRMSKPAVEGLLGKLYVYMGKYTEALPLLEAAVTDVNANGQTSLYDYNETFAPGGQFLPINSFSGPNGPGQNMNDIKEAVVSKVYNSGPYGGNISGNNGLVLATWAQALYGPTDFRLLFYTDLTPDQNPNPAGRLRKYGVIYSRFGLQLPDLYLLRAECRARTNNLSGAVEDVEFLREHRIPPADAAVPTPIANDQNNLIKFIIDERTREFAMEGHRWFDMRRLSLDPLFANTVYTHTLYKQDGSTEVYTLNQPNRFVLKFPRNFTDANPDMPNNP